MSETEYGVVDKNVKPGKSRTHTIQYGEGLVAYYEFHHGKKTMVPASHAAKFQAVPSFQVYNSVGTPLKTIPTKHPAQVQATDLKLKEGQTIAALEELTREALLTRAYLFPGGDKFKQNTNKTALINFLLGLAPVADRIAAAADSGEDDPEMVMSPAEMDKLLGDKDSPVFEDEG